MNELALEIIIILLLLAANGVFAMSEIAVVASRKIRLQQLADSGNKQAQAALKLAKNPKEMFEIEQLSNEEDGGYHTVGGFIMNHVQHIPAEGQYFEWQNLRFEVLDMDGRRVDKVLITPLI